MATAAPGSPLPPAAYATFASRLGARIVDALAAMSAGLPGYVLMYVGLSQTKPGPAGGLTASGARLVAAGVGLAAIGIVVMTVYQCLRIARSGQTIGMQARRIRLQSVSGRPITAPMALGRYLVASVVSAPPLLAGFLWMRWDRQRQTWHDKIVGTVSVRT